MRTLFRLSFKLLRWPFKLLGRLEKVIEGPDEDFETGVPFFNSLTVSDQELTKRQARAAANPEQRRRDDLDARRFGPGSF